MKPLSFLLIVPIFGITLAQEVADINNNLIPDFQDSETDSLLTWQAPSDMQQKLPYYLSGFDEDNCPIWVAEFGKWDMRRIIEEGPERERLLRKYLHQFLQRALDSRKIKSSAEYTVTELNLIVDMEGYGAQQATSPPTLGLTLWFARQLEQAWRNKLKVGFIVNSNYLFSTVWGLMKPLLGRNVYKVDVFGHNKDRWIPAILKAFPKSEIPEWYGGSAAHKPLQIYG